MEQDSDDEGLLATAIPKKVKNHKWFGQLDASNNPYFCLSWH